MHWYGFGWGGMIFGGLMMLLFWGGLITLFIWLVRSLITKENHPQAPHQNGGASAREILDRRYARGEISREDYEVMKEDLAK